MSLKTKSLSLHEKLPGKIQISSPINIRNHMDLSLAYSPYVSEACLQIVKNPDNVNKYTSKSHMIAVVSDGSAVLGLGNIGPLAALPVMEGKALLFKRFANLDAIPICVNTQDPNEIIIFCEQLAPTFGGINLEDIKAPECVYIETELKKRLKIPVFHDDQHGTAIVVLAALINACRLLKKDIRQLKISLAGTGAAGSAIAKILCLYGVQNIYAYNANGIVHSHTKLSHDALTQTLIEEGIFKDKGETFENSLAYIIQDTDVFIGVSIGNIVTSEMIKSMQANPIVFALANPIPEILPEQAKKSGAIVIATGRSDYPNQVNNVLAFPGIFKGVLEVGATQITDAMKVAAAEALANIITDDDLNTEYIIPSVFDERVVKMVSDSIHTLLKNSSHK